MDEIVRINDESLIPVGDSIIQVAEQAERRIEAVNKIKALSLRVTNSSDWVDQNGKPYLQVSGAEKIARLFGVSWTISEPIFNVEEDGHFSYCFNGNFTLGGATIEAIGVRSSKDGFFKKYTNNTEGERVLLPPSEIDKGDVRKSAYTNLLGNGISRLLGLRGMTWEEVEAGGIIRGKAGKVDYTKKENQGVNSDSSAKRQEHEQRIKEALVALYGEDKEAMKAKVIELTTWTDKQGKEHKGVANYTSIKSDQSISILCSKLEALVKKDKPLPEMCSECHKPIVDGKCSNNECPEHY